MKLTQVHSENSGGDVFVHVFDVDGGPSQLVVLDDTVYLYPDEETRLSDPESGVQHETEDMSDYLGQVGFEIFGLGMEYGIMTKEAVSVGVEYRFYDDVRELDTGNSFYSVCL